MTQMKEIGRNSVQGVLGSDLGQTFPEFTTAGSAGYGVTRKPYFFVRGSERVNVAGYINHRSDDYKEVVTALQGIGPVRGIARIGSYDRNTRSQNMKVSSVGNGLGQATFVPEQANVSVENFVRIPGDLSGLSNIEEEAVLYGNVGLGQSMDTMRMRRAQARRASSPSNRPVTAPTMGMMAAIIKTAKDLNETVRKANQRKINAARSNPLTAMKLAASAKRKSIPGTNVQTAIIKAMNQAGRFAQQAIDYRKRSEKALASGDKSKAAFFAVRSMEFSRNAANIAYSAEKTKVATAADQVAKVAAAQAETLRNAASKLDAQRGPNPTSDKLRAQASALEATSKSNKNASALMASQPAQMPGVPSQRRIAELSNKYNIRSAGIEGNVALLSTLNGFANDPLAQAQDYEGAVLYYGNDVAGRLMADIEYGNLGDVMAGLSAIDGLGDGFSDFMNMVGGVVKGASDAIGGATKAIQSGVQAVQNGYNAVADAAKKVGIPLPGGTKPPSVVATSTAAAVTAPSYSSRPSQAVRPSRPTAPSAGPQFAPQTPPTQPPQGGMPIGLIVGGVAVVGIGAFFLLKN